MYMKQLMRDLFMAPVSSMIWSGLMFLWWVSDLTMFFTCEQTYEGVRKPQLTVCESSRLSFIWRPCLWRNVTR